MSVLASRRALLGSIAALPALAVAASANLAPALATVNQSPLARVCHRTVARCQWLDVAENVADLSEEDWDIELALQGEVFDRAIAIPSHSIDDLRAKAALALDDLDRFHPESEERDPGQHLIAVVLKEVIALCT